MHSRKLQLMSMAMVAWWLLLLLGILVDAQPNDISFDVDMPSFLARHDLEWGFQWVDGDPHIPCVSCSQPVDTP